MSEDPANAHLPSVPDDLRRTSPARTPECDLERRRRFLKVVVRAGAFGLAVEGLAGILRGEKTGQGGNPPCTTTKTYTSSTSESQSFPSAPSSSFSYTSSCFFGYGGSETAPYSWSHVGGFQGGNATSTYSGEVTQSWGQPGTFTHSESPCEDDVLSATYSYPSYPSWSSSYSKTESGTKTALCSDNVYVPPGLREPGAGGAVPATLEDERAVLRFPSRLRELRARHLALFGRYPEQN